METIGLIAAMPKETAALLRYVNERQRILVSSLRSYRFVLSGQTCVLVTSGMGFRRAGEAARYLVETYAPKLIISFGIAGAVDADLEIGDVVLAEAVCQLEHGEIGTLMPLAHWPVTARETITKVLAKHGRRAFPGTAITTRASQVQRDQLGDLEHPVLEMETAAIAQVAAGKGISLLSLRAISDGPRAPIPINLDELMNEDANLQVGKMVRAIIHHPKIILASRRILRNSSLAADYAALALMAGLKSLGSDSQTEKEST